MNTENIISSLQNLEIKLKTLIEQNKMLKSQLSDFQKENNSLNALIDKQNEEIKSFQNKEKITKIVSSMADGTQINTELKLKINEYIKEIDRCIVYLSE